jgi:4-amino-4-deoxy-L-arabinose transferase-like glycosyltransferase
LSATFPDAMFSACLFLAAWCCVKAAGGASSTFYILLGLTLAAGYYVKPTGFVVALILLAILLAWPPAQKSRRRVALALLVFCAASLPLVIAISKKAGEVTISEDGKLVYVWEVNGFYKELGWTGQQSAEHGVPLHPPRIAFTEPLVLEFASPVGGTYPLTDDPAYWFAGVRIRFNLRQQVSAIVNNYRKSHAGLDYGLLWVGAIALAILGGRRLRESLPAPVRWIVAWPLCTCAMFMTVHLEHRYMAPFVVLLAVGVYSWLASGTGEAANVVLLILSIAMIFSIASFTGHSVAHIVEQRETHYRSDDLKMADSLSMSGLRAGDSIATVGFTFDSYWAHIGKLRIVAQALDKNEFWKTDESRMDELMTRLKSLGIKAVVARAGGEARRPGWRDLPPHQGEIFREFLLQ